MNNFIIPSEWQPNNDINLEENAEKAIKLDRNALIVAGPGAGKTEMLAQKTDYLFKTNLCQYPRKILAISFKKDSAENLKERILTRYGKEYAARFTSLTYDAFAKKTLDQFRSALPTELRPNKNYQIGDNAIIEAAFNKCGFVNLEHLTGNRLISFFDSELYKTDLPLNTDSESANVWRLLLKGFDDYPACLTFKMISKLANYIYLTNPYVTSGMRSTYAHVFLDEFQDTTNLQYELVKTCFKDTDVLVTAVGDNKQRIMVWAGARKTVFKDFLNDFQAKKISLVMNHRSAPKLIELQRLMYDSLKESELELHSSSKWGDEQGDIKLFVSKDEDLEAIYLAGDIMEKIAEGITTNDICILVKQLPQNYANVIISKLAEHGVKARIEIEYQELLKEQIVSLLLDTLTLSIQRKSPDAWENVNNTWIKIHGLENNKQTDLYYQKHKQLISMLDKIKSRLPLIHNEESFRELIFFIVDEFGKDEIKALFPSYAQGDFFVFLLDKMSKLFWIEYKESRDWYQMIENFKGNNSIPIMTIHKSKGLEYKAVYFIGLEDGAFWNFKNQPEEDRCAFLVALSRAKSYLSFSFCSYRKSLKYKRQKRTQINEFFELLQKPGIAKIIDCD